MVSEFHPDTFLPWYFLVGIGDLMAPRFLHCRARLEAMNELGVTELFNYAPPRSRLDSSRWRSRSPSCRNRAPPPSFPRSRLSPPVFIPPPLPSFSPPLSLPYGRMHSSPRRHFPPHQQFQPLPREDCHRGSHWRDSRQNCRV